MSSFSGANSGGRPLPERKYHIYQGKYKVSDQENAVMCAILGSCVAACLHDPVAGIGGMNHFLVPGDGSCSQSLSHGTYSMELLINSMLKRGASRDRIVAKLFGGAAVVSGLSNIGQKNASFASDFLQMENIPCVSSSLGGEAARRIMFWPSTGRARQLMIPINEIEEKERRVTVERPAVKSDAGDLELF